MLGVAIKFHGGTSSTALSVQSSGFLQVICRFLALTTSLVPQTCDQSSSTQDNSKICNRYTAHASEIDAYVADHPDLVVIFAAGDHGTSSSNGLDTVSSPGTCKNCITVGSTQSW